MSAPRLRLTPELSQQIAAGIRAGGYPFVAAEAYGIAKEVFDDWLARGNQKHAREPFRSFALEVCQAFAQARLRAESEEFTKHPKLWLVQGPGRESEQRPGWSVSVKPVETTGEAHNALLDRQVMALCHSVQAALEPFAEARANVAQVLVEQGLELGKERGRQGGRKTRGQEDKETEHGATSV